MKVKSILIAIGATGLLGACETTPGTTTTVAPQNALAPIMSSIAGAASEADLIARIKTNEVALRTMLQRNSTFLGAASGRDGLLKHQNSAEAGNVLAMLPLSETTSDVTPAAIAQAEHAMQLCATPLDARACARAETLRVALAPQRLSTELMAKARDAQGATAAGEAVDWDEDTWQTLKVQTKTYGDETAEWAGAIAYEADTIDAGSGDADPLAPAHFTRLACNTLRATDNIKVVARTAASSGFQSAAIVANAQAAEAILLPLNEETTTLCQSTEEADVIACEAARDRALRVACTAGQWSAPALAFGES